MLFEDIYEKSKIPDDIGEGDIRIRFIIDNGEFFPDFYKFEGKGKILFYQVKADNIEDHVQIPTEKTYYVDGRFQLLLKIDDHENEILFLEFPIIYEIEKFIGLITDDTLNIIINDIQEGNKFFIREYKNLKELGKQIKLLEAIENSKHRLSELSKEQRYKIAWRYFSNSEDLDKKRAMQLKTLHDGMKIYDLHIEY